MSILIIGSEGSMGRRYQAILKYLGYQYICADKQHSLDDIAEIAHNTAGAIVATPTDTHVEIVKRILPAGKPILCEKPVTKNLAELNDLITEIEHADSPFRMTYQYKHLAGPSRLGRSFYNYFKHGNDGLAWDCMQIIGLARGEVQLQESSPIWSCMINGKALVLSHMDAAYIAEVQTWLQKPKGDLAEIRAVHERVHSADKVIIQ